MICLVMNDGKWSEKTGRKKNKRVYEVEVEWKMEWGIVIKREREEWN